MTIAFLQTVVLFSATDYDRQVYIATTLPKCIHKVLASPFGHRHSLIIQAVQVR